MLVVYYYEENIVYKITLYVWPKTQALDILSIRGCRRVTIIFIRSVVDSIVFRIRSIEDVYLKGVEVGWEVNYYNGFRKTENCNLLQMLWIVLQKRI